MAAKRTVLGFDPILEVGNLTVSNSKDFIKLIMQYNGFAGSNPAKVQQVYDLWFEQRNKISYYLMAVYGHLILNKKNNSNGVYLGRPSIFGNTYSHLPTKNLAEKKVDTRDQAVAHYAYDFKSLWSTNLVFQNNIKNMRNKHLVCWCAPLLCHCIYAAATANRGPVKLTTKSIYTAKDQKKADISQSFIGIGAEGSSTDIYRSNYGLMANKLNYAETEKVFVSINGNRKDAVKIEAIQIYLMAAINAKAWFVTDNLLNRNRDYNSGERELAEFLKKNFYVEDATLSGSFSIWKSSL
jgi:hypothetical protein